jgi:DNA-binding response OmpR family regulator
METKREILVVEDERVLATGICDVLAFHGYAPTAVGSGEEGLQRAIGGHYALVLLDVMLPGVGGFDVCRELRDKRPELAILMLTARGSESDVLEGFRSGADDYVTKPFSVAELMARVEALLRRSLRLPAGDIRPFTLAGWTIDPAARTACDGKRSVELTPREVDMLAVRARSGTDRQSPRVTARSLGDESCRKSADAHRGRARGQAPQEARHVRERSARDRAR